MPCASKVCSNHLRCDLVHADVGAELLRQLGERASRFAGNIVGLLGGTLIDADAAPAHLMHHRQQIDLQPIGVARAFPLDDRPQIFKQPQRGDRVDLGVGADERAGSCQMYRLIESAC